MSLKDSPSEKPQQVPSPETGQMGVIGALRTHVRTWARRYVEMRIDAAPTND